MAKLFDSMAKLKFKEDSDGKPTKEAVGMYSKDGEYVDFDEPCKCVGQVRIIHLYERGIHRNVQYHVLKHHLNA